MEKVTFVIREERERERDPVLGIVEFKTLGEAFNERSEVVKWYPLVGGIGYGIMSARFQALERFDSTDASLRFRTGASLFSGNRSISTFL